MLNKEFFDDLAEKLSDALPKGASALKEDAKKNIRAVLESAFAKMNLVTREEFEAQQAVLQRAKETLAELEARVKQIEAKE